MIAWLAAAFLAMAAMISPARAEQKASEAQVAVLRPLEFLRIDNLHFGEVMRGSTAGTVTIAPDGTKTATGGATPRGTGHQPARFAGMGVNGQIVNVSLGANQIFLTGPGTRMRVRNFVIGSTPTAILSTTPRRFRIGSASGLFAFPVGATLDVGANQAAGTYTGTWTITLNYQ